MNPAPALHRLCTLMWSMRKVLVGISTGYRWLPISSSRIGLMRGWSTRSLQTRCQCSALPPTLPTPPVSGDGSFSMMRSNTSFGELLGTQGA